MYLGFFFLFFFFFRILYYYFLNTFYEFSVRITNFKIVIIKKKIFYIQVINIINAAQESSPMPVAEALDRVLEILRTTELYSPQLGTKDEDPHTNDLVGGLMTVSSTSLRV